MKVLRSAILISVGVFAIVFGEADDAPGLQGLGLILIASAFFLYYRGKKRK